MITSASDDKLINFGCCKLHLKLGQKTFEYYFQIIKNLKRDLIIGLNFQRTFKISQDITDDDDLYLHIRNNIITFSIQAKNVKNNIKMKECLEIHGKSWKQFNVKAPKGLKGGQIYEIDFNAKGLLKDVIPVLDTFIARNHQKFIEITLINQLDEPVQIPGGRHIALVHLVEGGQPSEEEAVEILHQIKPQPHDVNYTDEFITREDQIQLKRPIHYGDDSKLSPEMRKALDDIIQEYTDIFSKDQYDMGISTHLPVEIPTEGPPCISTPYTIPLKFRPWADNTINKLLEAGMVQRTMSTWASPVIIIPKKGLEIDPKKPNAPLPPTTHLRLVCDYRKLNSKLPADFWKYDKQGCRIVKQGINAPYPLPKINEMFDTIKSGYDNLSVVNYKPVGYNRPHSYGVI